MAELTEERRRRLISLSCELMYRVREVDPQRNATWLESIREDWRDLLIILAALADPNVPMSTSLGWTDELVPDDAL